MFSSFLALISWTIQGILRLRHWAYDQGIFPSKKVQGLRTLVVGNVALGGSGKSPMVAHLLAQAHRFGKVGVLSRGYGRKTKGFVWVKANATASMVGDELLELHEKFPEIPMAAGEDRLGALARMKAEIPDLQWVILDDGFQHRALRPDLVLVCSSFTKPFFQDALWPLGTLRDLPQRVQAAQLLVFTKCPKDLNPQIQSEYQAQVQHQFPHLQVHFSSIQLSEPQGPRAQGIQAWHVVLGIAQPQRFIDQVQAQYQVLSQSIFKDHQRLAPAELQKLETLAKSLAPHQGILCSSKDYARWKEQLSEYPNLTQKLAHWPMEMHWVSPAQDFWAALDSCMKQSGNND